MLVVWYSRWVPTGALFFEDFILNILLYIPVGVFASLSLRRRAFWLQVIVPILIGFVLSLGVESIQVYDPRRVPSLLDLISNTAGAGFGTIIALAATGPLVRVIGWLGERMDRSRSASALLGLWLADRLFPVFPQFGIWSLKTKFAAFVTRSGSLSDAGRSFVLYLSVGLLFQRLSRRHARMSVAIALGLVPFEFFLLGRQPLIAELLGATLAVGCWFALRGRPAYIRLSAISAVLFLLFSGLAPYHFQDHPNAFSWTPLEATFSFDRFDALRVLVGKMTLYGSTLWLLRAAGWRWPVSAIFIAVLLASIEFAQRWLPGRTPEATDPIIALCLATLFYFLDKSSSPRTSQLASKKLRSST